jgi:hypothetical protein
MRYHLTWVLVKKAGALPSSLELNNYSNLYLLILQEGTLNLQVDHDGQAN